MYSCFVTLALVLALSLVRVSLLLSHRSSECLSSSLYLPIIFSLYLHLHCTGGVGSESGREVKRTRRVCKQFSVSRGTRNEAEIQGGEGREEGEREEGEGGVGGGGGEGRE